jgi:hypothetical protein
MPSSQSYSLTITKSGPVNLPPGTISVEADRDVTLRFACEPQLRDGLSVFPLGPWRAECDACDDESGNVSEAEARAWAAAHTCQEPFDAS